MERRWSAQRASQWYADKPLLVGANFTPSCAINQIEMWARASWDPATIRRELGWAADIGMNTMRVFLHDLVWSEEGDGFLDRVEEFLDICADSAIAPLLVIFDDCWHEPVAGKQPAPRPGIHNSGWARSPGRDILLDPVRRNGLEKYVKSVIERFGHDERVLAWDLYNEPTNFFLPSRSLAKAEREAERRRILGEIDTLREASLALLENAFGWAREIDPIQPLTAGAWNGDRELNALLFSFSDIISFHNYQPPQRLEQIIEKLQRHGRPILCTEYMARRHGSTFANHLPVFAREKIGSYCWGLVDGKTQTKYAWEDEDGRWAGREPDPWFHDVFHRDGSPYDAGETRLIAQVAGEWRKCSAS